MMEYTEEEQKFIDENKEGLDIVVENLYLLFNPTKTQSQKELCDFVDALDEAHRIWLDFFVINTCGIVNGLEESHIAFTFSLFNSFSQEEIKYFSDIVRYGFTSPVKIQETGFIEWFWSTILEITNQRVATAIKETAVELEQPKPEENIIEQLELEPIAE